MRARKPRISMGALRGSDLGLAVWFLGGVVPDCAAANMEHHEARCTSRLQGKHKEQ